MDVPAGRQVSLQFSCGHVSLVCPAFAVLESVDGLPGFLPYWLSIFSLNAACDMTTGDFKEAETGQD